MLAAGILLLAYADFIVLEHIYKPLTGHYGIPESALHVPGSGGRIFWWHAAFLPLGIIMFVLMGIAGRDWRLAVAGIVLFATGWEDIAYYALQGKMLPAQMAWLDPQPFVAWTKLALHQPHVTGSGVGLAACLGGLIVLCLLTRSRKVDPGQEVTHADQQHD